MTEYLTVAEAAERLRVSRQTIYNWVDEGRITGAIQVKTGPRHGVVRIPSDFIEQLLAPKKAVGE